MVRLKDLPSEAQISFSEISIPYGAIKRYPNLLISIPEKTISIPYGAIKR